MQQKTYPELYFPERILLGPGPSMVAPRVLRAMSIPLVGHLDPTFIGLMIKIQELLRYTFQTENPITIPLSGTGSAGMEASFANSIEPGEPVVIFVNGYFGLRMVDMAERYQAKVHALNKPWGEIFSVEEIRQTLKDHPAKVVGIIQAETSTGALQDNLKEIAEIVHNQGGLLIVDAVTSLGGVPLQVDQFDIDICYSGTQKCLGCPPGLAPITLGHRAIDKLSKRKSKVPNWYLDLSMILKYWGNERTYHHTAPITANYGLYEGLRQINEEGLENRWARHQKHAEFLWDGLKNIGLECYVPKAHRLPSLTTVKIPEGMDDAGVRNALLSDYNIEIAGGLGELKGKVWRIGLMGYSSRMENILILLEALKQIIRKSSQ